MIRDHDKFVTSVRRKDTFSGVYTNFNSFIPEAYKRGLVLTLLYRGYRINSAFIGLHEEIVKLKDILRRNSYPPKFLDRCVFKFLNKLYVKRETVLTAPKKEVTIVLPFLGSNSWSIKNSLKRAFQKSHPICNLNVIYKTGNSLSSYFQFKDSFPKTIQSGVVYYYPCARCKLSYVGSTKCFWEKRLEEHLHISALTGARLYGKQWYPPLIHVKSDKCSQTENSREDFKILCHEKNPYLVKLKESLFIYKLRPQLNGYKESTRLYLFN